MMRALWLPIACLLLVTAATADDALDTASRSRRAAFEQGRTERLEPLLDPERKVYLALPSVYERSGHLGPSQLRYVFRDIFKRWQTVAVRLEELEGGDQTELVYLRMRWRYRARDSDDQTAVRVCLVELSLERGERGLVLVELREAER